MSQTVLDSLPYIDAPPTAEQVRAANDLINNELKACPGPSATIPERHSFLSPAGQKEMDRLQNDSSSKLNAIDVSRYANNSDLVGTAMQYQLSRQEQIELLAQYGTHQWIIANDVLLSQLNSLDQKVDKFKSVMSAINADRKRKQLTNETLLTYLTTRRQELLESLVEINIELESQRRKKQRI